MRHPALLMPILALLFAPPAKADSELTRKWTQGRSSCDPAGRQILDTSVPNPVDHSALDLSWDYSIQDAETLSSLQCYPEAAKAAAELVTTFRALNEEVLPGINATSCTAGAKADRLSRVREAEAKMRAAESLFSRALDRADEEEKQISAANPVGLPFDDCRAKAQRGWASARQAFNKFSCDFSQTIERLETYHEGAELAAGECQAPVVAKAAAPEAPAIPVMAVMPAANPAYPAFTGAEPPANR
ncbi:MAG: hypothetical protein ACXVB9_16830 [Bdellovibrionota bacterium]